MSQTAVGASLAIMAISVLVWPQRSPLEIGLVGGPHGDRWSKAPGSGSLGRLSYWARARSTTAVRVAVAGAAVAAGSVAAAAVSLPFGLVVGAVLPLVLRSVAAVLAARRSRRDLRLDTNAVASLAAELRAGQTMGAALRASAHGASPQAAKAFLSAATAVEIGADPIDLLLAPPGESESGRAPSAAQHMIAAIWRLSLSAGCPLAEGIDAVEADLRERARHADHLRSLLAGPNASAALLAALPVFGLLMGGAVGADPWRVLTETALGGGLLLTGAALSLLGLLWTRTLVSRAARAA